MLVAAAQTPMKGTCAAFTSGTIASETGLSIPPNRMTARDSLARFRGGSGKCCDQADLDGFPGLRRADGKAPQRDRKCKSLAARELCRHLSNSSSLQS